MSRPKDAPPGDAPMLSIFLRRTGSLLLLTGIAALWMGGGGCSPEEEGSHSTGGSGGSTGTGSNAGSGGSTGTGSGGFSAGMNSGGASATGGASTGGTSPGSGGAPGSGGFSAGSGGSATGGSGTGSGGRTSGSGGAATGGRPGFGGASAATGGASAGTGGALSASGGASGPGGAMGAGGATSAHVMMNFFVTSETSTTANLGGLSGADMRCQRLATAVGAGAKTWRAYLSAATPATDAIDRIGPGPYYNAQGMMIAADKAALHARAGDAALFITERGARVNGQWANSPAPIEHDILTGTLRDGTIATGNTCGDWTATSGNSQVGHSDGLGPNMGTSGMLSYWNSAHTGQCGNTSPGGGAGRIYCFVGP
jgi:hypothetical protein